MLKCSVTGPVIQLLRYFGILKLFLSFGIFSVSVFLQKKRKIALFDKTIYHKDVHALSPVHINNLPNFYNLQACILEVR